MLNIKLVCCLSKGNVALHQCQNKMFMILNGKIEWIIALWTIKIAYRMPQCNVAMDIANQNDIEKAMSNVDMTY